MYRFKSVGVALSPVRVSHFRLDAVIFLSFILIIEPSIQTSPSILNACTVFDNWYRIFLPFLVQFILFDSEKILAGNIKIFEY